MYALSRYGSESKRSLKPKPLTLRSDQPRVALRVPRGKRLDNAVDLLRLARKTDVHQELPQGDIQRIGLKVELGEIMLEGASIE